MKHVLSQLAVAFAVLGLGLAAPEVLAAKQAPKANKAAPAAKSAPAKKSVSAAQPGRKPSTTHARAARAGVKTPPQAKSRSGGRAAPRAHAAAPPRAQPQPPRRPEAVSGDSETGSGALASPSDESGSPAPATRRPKPIGSRAYAIDGETFFHHGRKIRVQGIDRPDQGQANNEVEKQRLQTLLDSGEVSIHPVTTDEAGSTLAVVRVNGRDVADRLRGEMAEQAQ